MADLKISDLVAATTPLAGSELVPIVQSGATKRVTIAQLASSLTSLGTLSSLAVSGSGTAVDIQGATGIRARVLATAGGTPGLILSSAGATAWTIKAGNGDSSLRFDQDGTDRFYLASGGNVGSGVASPLTKMDIVSNGYAAYVARAATAGANQTVVALRAIDINAAFFADAIHSAQSHTFHVNGTNAAWQMNASGHFLAATDATYDIGASGANRPRDYYGSGNGKFGGKVGIGSTGTVVFQTEVIAASGADRDIFLAGVSGVTNGLTVKWNNTTSKTLVNIANIPTAATGLPAGTLYNDAGTIKIV